MRKMKELLKKTAEKERALGIVIDWSIRILKIVLLFLNSK